MAEKTILIDSLAIMLAIVIPTITLPGAASPASADDVCVVPEPASTRDSDLSQGRGAAWWRGQDDIR